jgi:hypothetical protein
MKEMEKKQGNIMGLDFDCNSCLVYLPLKQKTSLYYYLIQMPKEEKQRPKKKDELS